MLGFVSGLSVGVCGFTTGGAVEQRGLRCCDRVEGREKDVGRGVWMMVKKVGVGGGVGTKTGSGQGFGSGRARSGSSGGSGENGSGSGGKKRGRKKGGSVGVSGVDGEVKEKKGDLFVEEGAGAESMETTPHRAVVARREAERLNDAYGDVATLRKKGRPGGVGGTVVFEDKEKAAEKVLVEEDVGRKLRWKFDFGMDERLDVLWKAWENMKQDKGELHKTEFDKIVAVNRDLVGFLLLYRMTSMILREQTEGDKEREKTWRALRQRIIDVEWDFDARARIDQQEAEKIVQVALAQQKDFTSEALAFIKGDRGRANAIWITLYAAVAAWEDRKSEKKTVKQEVFDQLMKAAKAMNDSSTVQGALSPVLKAVQNILTAPSQEQQAAVVKGIDDGAVEELGILIEQIRLYPATQYKSLHKRLIDIMAFLKKAKYGVDEILDPVAIKVPDIERNTPLARFKWTQAVGDIKMYS